MTHVMKKQAISCVEDYAKAVEKEAYDKVLNILWSKYDQIDNVLSSKEADNIVQMSTGTKYDKLLNKREALRSKIYLVLDFIEEVSLFRFEES